MALCEFSAMGVLGAGYSPDCVCLPPWVGPASPRVATISFRGSAGPRLWWWVEGGQRPREAERGAGNTGQAPGRGKPPGLGAGRPGSLTSAKLAARRLARDVH